MREELSRGYQNHRIILVLASIRERNPLKRTHHKCVKKKKEEKLKRSRYLTTAIFAIILILSVMIQSDIVSMVSSDIPVPPQASVTIIDPLEDLIYIYSGLPAEEYFDFVDVELVSLELSSFEPALDCTITMKAAPPVDLENTVWYTLMLDENNDLSDNSMDYPVNDVDTMYTVIYTETGGWTIERAKYQALGGWFVEDTEAGFGLASSWPGGFSIDISIPLTELPGLTEILPWKVQTQTFTYPSTFPDTGDFAPDEGLVYLTPEFVEIVFDDNLAFNKDEIVYEQGQTFEITVFHDLDTTVSMIVTDPNQTYGVSQLTWNEFTYQTDIKTTLFRVSIPQNAPVGDYITTFEVIDTDGIIVFQQSETWNNRFGQSIQKPTQGTGRVDPTTGKSWTEKETSYWTQSKEGRYYPHGTLPGLTVPSDLGKQIKDIRKSLKVDGATKPTDAANKKRKWISDDTGWVTDTLNRTTGRPTHPLPDGSRPRIGRDYCYGDAKKLLDRIQKAKKDGIWAPGQCMDFAVLLADMLKVEGIPARVVTGVDVNKWNFHCWVEMWDGNSWKVLDATPGYEEDAMSRKDYWKNHNLANGHGFPGKAFIYDPNTGQLADITRSYKNSTASVPEEFNMNVFTSTSKPEYLIGEDIEINIEFENVLGVTRSITYNALVRKLPEIGEISNIIITDPDLFVLNETGVLTIPPLESANVSYILDKTMYVDNGDYCVIVTTNETSTLTGFRVNGGLRLSVSLPTSVDVYQTFDLAVNITNDLAIPVDDIDVFVSLSYYSSLSDISFNITTLAPSEVWSTTFPMNMSRSGDQTIWIFASSAETGFVYEVAPFTVLSYPLLEVRNDYSRDWISPGNQFVITSYISNLGDYPINDISVNLQLFEGISTDEPLTRNIADLSAGETEVITWTVTAGEDTGIFMYMISASDQTWQTIDTNYAFVELSDNWLVDLDRSRVINILDISIAASAFGSTPGHPRWIAVADVNMDEEINILDIAAIALEFGKTY